MDDLLSSHLETKSSEGLDGLNTICFLDITSAAEKKQKTDGDRIPSTPVRNPFPNWSSEKLYDYWKAKIRHNLNTTKTVGWTSFIFAILDAESIENHDLLMCSDGSDFGEGNADTKEDETKLKSIRMTFSTFARFMPALEVLTITSGEMNKEQCLNVTPPVLINPEYLGAMTGKIGTPNEMRKRKREAIWKAEAEGWAEKHG